MTRLTRIALACAAVAALALGGSALASALQSDQAPKRGTQESTGEKPDRDADDSTDDDGERADRGDDESVTGADAERARQAALKSVGGGQVHEVERSDDPGEAYSVEVTRPDGREVEVELDDAFAVISTDVDDRDRESGEDD